MIRHSNASAMFLDKTYVMLFKIKCKKRDVSNDIES